MDKIKCLKCKQVVPILSRGLCSPCYQSALHAVSRGKTTWKKLMFWGEAKEARTKRNWGVPA